MRIAAEAPFFKAAFSSRRGSSYAFKSSFDMFAPVGTSTLTVQRSLGHAVSSGDDGRSNNDRSRFTGVVILLQLAGVNPNSDAIRNMISAWRLAIET